MNWTLVAILWLGSSAGQSVIVPNLPTLQSCESLAQDIAKIRGNVLSFHRCVETIR